MKESIRQELLSHVIDTIKDKQLTDFDELHYYAFNEDYYIIYHSRAIAWLKKHDIDSFEAIAEVIEWESEVFGEVTLQPEDITPEKIVNLYVYIKGEELLSDYDLTLDAASLLATLNDDLNEVQGND